MPRADRCMMVGYTFHLTHRCHNRAFLLQFARDRDAYRKWLRIGAARYKVPVFAYSVTCNHVAVQVRDRNAVGRLMDLASGATARQYSRRKARNGAFWEGKYHATAAKSGRHLWRCLRCVDLKMVRSGEVGHPRQWRWCGYNELMRLRRRYRIVDMGTLLLRLDGVSEESFREEYAAEVDRHISARTLAREAAWTEGLAVGTRPFTERVARETGRSQLNYTMLPSSPGSEVWCVREPPENACGVDDGAKTTANTPTEGISREFPSVY